MQGLQLLANTSGLSMAFSYRREEGRPDKEQKEGERNGGYVNTLLLYEIIKNKNLNEKVKNTYLLLGKKSVMVYTNAEIKKSIITHKCFPGYLDCAHDFIS